ncbi:MAG: hypothetical protein HC892_01680 [Saprospiraceae bacterium]|nr:hypothetical protein [Saprospiraceae bacterium]
MANGIIQGDSHENGGIKGIIKGSNKPIEVEGGEAIIKKEAVENSELHDFNGKK